MWTSPLHVAGLLLLGSVSAAAQSPGQPDPVAAYFDMMDGIRTEAWGRPVWTPPEERQRVRALLEQHWHEIDPQTQAAIMQFPQTWDAIRRGWEALPEVEKVAQREQWRLQLLLPTQMVPPPAHHQTYRSAGDTLVFDYPSNWTGGETQWEDTYFLFLRPPVYQPSWEQVLNPATSPPGALFAVCPLDEEMRAVGSCLEGARLVARRSVSPYLPGLREVDAVDLGADGAIITLVGPGVEPGDERFYWVAAAPFGSTHYFAARLGGPTSEAETLVPALCNLVSTIEVNPPRSAGPPGDASSLEIDVAVGQISNQVWEQSWYEFNHPGWTLEYE